MISNSELFNLVERLRAHGAKVDVTYDADLKAAEDRDVIASVSVAGVRGIGPHPMSPIAAAERIREALYAIEAYSDKVEGRQERLEDRAAALRQEGNARIERGSSALRAIPFGQPILVGHHSERRDRNYRERAGNNIGKGVEALNKAEHYERRAASVGTAGISSDNPLAVAELKTKLEKLKASQARMVAANKCVRKKDRDGLAALGFNPSQVEELFKPDFCGRVGFPSYALTNNSGNMRRIEQRIEQLERVAVAETKEVEHESGVRVVENVEANRVQLFFPGKPSDEVRSELKSSGFRWSPSEGAWQRHLNGAGKWAAQRVVEYLNKQGVNK